MNTVEMLRHDYAKTRLEWLGTSELVALFASISTLSSDRSCER